MARTKIRHYPMGRLPSPFDVRDYNTANFIPVNAWHAPFGEKQEMVWDFPSTSLDQGLFQHCVGFSMAHFGINSPINTLYTKDDAHNFYYQCKAVDGRPGLEEGTYIRSAAKVLKNEYIISKYAFARNLQDIKWWLLNKGPIIVGTIWTVEMFTPDENHIIRIGGEVVGGHAYLLNEWRSDDYIGFQNSWGEHWGDNGKAYISSEHFDRLFSHQGEALSAVELDPSQIEEIEETIHHIESDHWLCVQFKLLLDFLKDLVYNYKK